MSTIQYAALIRAYGGADAVEIAEVDRPEAAQGQVLVKVRAAGMNGLDWKVREGYVRDAFPLQLPAILGIELAGFVEAVGTNVSRFRVGDRVMGALGGLGAYAEFVAVDESNLCRTPDTLDDVHAAALPVATVAAWQSLHYAGPIRQGHRILIHGAAGGLGGYAVQFAKQLGAEVFGTASTAHLDYVRALARTMPLTINGNGLRTSPKTWIWCSTTSVAKCSIALGRFWRPTVLSSVPHRPTS
jgi:NADPH:quinone reductase-like Zn-dependent oxidoreductase